MVLRHTCWHPPLLSTHSSTSVTDGDTERHQSGEHTGICSKYKIDTNAEGEIKKPSGSFRIWSKGHIVQQKRQTFRKCVIVHVMSRTSKAAVPNHRVAGNLLRDHNVGRLFRGCRNNLQYFCLSYHLSLNQVLFWKNSRFLLSHPSMTQLLRHVTALVSGNLKTCQ